MASTLERVAASGGRAGGHGGILVLRVGEEATCDRCGRKVSRGGLQRVRRQQSLCLACADLDRLVFLPGGNAALTRRASRYSALRAVVIGRGRSRWRRRRQGLLVEKQALARAEKECEADEEARGLARKLAAARRAEHDLGYVRAFARRVGELYPGCPADERRMIAEHACKKNSGRVGRSAEAKELQARAVRLAVRAHVRHAHTAYDELLLAGVGRDEAREKVSGAVGEWLKGWSYRA